MSEEPFQSEHIFTLLQDLTAIPAPTGHEEPVREWLRTRWRARVKEWHEDASGNILGCVGGSGPRLLITAHMDEIGFVVRSITDDGFLLLDTAQNIRLGGEKRYMIGQLAQIIGRSGIVAEGVFATSSGHVVTQTQLQKPAFDAHDFFVDIGAKSRVEVEARGVHIGAAIIWQAPLRRFGTRLVGKAFDDRLLLGVMDLLLNVLDPEQLTYNLWFAATVQEENGLHGAYGLGQHAHFDLAIVLDVGLVGDIPTTRADDYPNMLGSGPTLVHKDQMTHYHERFLWHVADVATQHALPFQHGVFQNYGSDGVALIQHNIRTLLIAVPTRYTHSPFEMVEESDILATVHLLHKLVTTNTFSL